jgi:hypothetical protein
MIETLVLSVIASLGVTSVALSNILFLGLSGLFYVGASLGLSLLSSLLFKPQTPKPEDVQQQTKQPISPRYRHYGRVKVSGNWTFAESKNGNFYKVVAVGQGPIDAIEQFWIDDYLVTVDSSTGFVSTGVTDSGKTFDYGSKVQIRYRLGTGSDLNYSELSSVFPEWTSDHRGRGVVSIFATQFAVGQEQYLKTFPSGINTNYRVVMRGVLIENPVTLSVSWDDNAASVIRDFLYNAEGLRLPKALLTTPLASAGWIAAYNKSETAYSLAAGGTEPRYRLWGSYHLEERPADVLNRMLICCDGRLMITNDGGLTLDIGDVPASPVVIDESMIVGFSELGRGRDILSTANTIRATFLNPDQDYQSSDADPWVQAEDAAVRGEIAQSYEFPMAPSHSQCRRLMKLAAFRSNPDWVGSFVCNLKALAAFGERYCTISFPTLGINQTFEILDFRFDVGENDILNTVTIQVQSLPAAAYAWDADQEEGDAPVYESSNGTSTIPDVTDFNAVIQRKEISGTLYPYALLTFDPAPSPLQTEAQGRRVGDTSWTPIAVSEGSSSAESFLLADGETYEFQVRYRAISVGAWTSSAILVATADPVAPGIITSLIATPDDTNNEVDFSWQSPNSANFAATNIYRNTVNNEGTATLVHTEYGAANFPFTYSNPSGTGTFYFWLRARNFSGVESASVASGAITVT